MLNIINLIKSSLDLYRKNWKLFLKYTLWLYIPSLALSLVALAITMLSNLLPGEKLGGTLSAIIFLVTILAAGVFAIWVTVAYLRVIAKSYTNKKIDSLDQELKAAKQLIIPTITAGILVVLAVLGGSLLFIVPGIIFSIWFTFSAHSVAIEGHGAVAAMKHSKSIVEGRWWKIFWLLFASTALYLLVLTVGEFIINTPFSLVKNVLISNTIITSISDFFMSLMAMILNFVFVPLVYSTQTILYMELRKPRGEMGK